MLLGNKKGQPSPVSDRKCNGKKWKAIFGNDPPLRLGGKLLSRILEHAQQELSISSVSRNLERKFADALSSQTKIPSQSSARVGDRIIRGWGGINHEITVLPKGYSYRGDVYRSLSEIARLITGARWSGPRFFGIRKKAI